MRRRPGSLVMAMTATLESDAPLAEGSVHVLVILVEAQLAIARAIASALTTTTVLPSCELVFIFCSPRDIAPMEADPDPPPTQGRARPDRGFEITMPRAPDCGARPEGVLPSILPE